MKTIFDKSCNSTFVKIEIAKDYRTPTAKEFGKILKEVREANKMTQEELAQLANISTRSYQKNEQGETWMSTETFIKIMIALNKRNIGIFYVRR